MIDQPFIEDISKARAKRALAKLKQELAGLRKDTTPTEDELLIAKAEAEYYTDVFESVEKDK